MTDVDQDMSAPGDSPGDDDRQMSMDNSADGEVVGSAAMRPVFLGNLTSGYAAADVQDIFERPILPRDATADTFPPIPVERVDLKRGYCFVFLKDALTEAAKERAERFVSEINGM